jgi:hypothetical protein
MRCAQPTAATLRDVHSRVSAQLAPREGRKGAERVAREVVRLVRERMREDPGFMTDPGEVEVFVALATRCTLVEYQRTPSRRREGEWALFTEVV